MRLSFALLTLLLIVSAAAAGRAPFARTPAEAEAWLQIRTDNFIFISNADEKTASAAAERLDAYARSVNERLPRRAAADLRRLTVYYFRDGAAYLPFKPRRPDGSIDQAAAGYFQPDRDGGYIAAAPAGRDLLSPLFHEYAHFALDAAYGQENLPAWVGEGIAEYYASGPETVLTQATTATAGHSREFNLRRVRGRRLMPLQEFFGTSYKSLPLRSAEERLFFYAQSWLLIEYLTATRGTDGLGKFLDALAAKTPVAAAVSDAFGMTLGEIELKAADFAAAAAVPKFSAPPILLDARPAVENFIVERLRPDRARLLLADLLIRTGDYPTAESYLASADRVEALPLLGMLRLRQEKFAEAQKLLAAAIDAGVRSAGVYFDYAYALFRANAAADGTLETISADDAERVRRALRLSLESDPSFAESFRLFAQLALIDGKELEAARELLITVLRRRSADAAPTRLLYAQVLLRLEDYELASAAAQLVLDDAAADGPSRLAAQEVIDAAVRYREAEAAARPERFAFAKMQQPAPIIIRREALTNEQIAKIDEDRVLNNLNRLLPKPSAGEAQTVGQIDSVICGDNFITYKISAAGRTFELFSETFDELKLAILIEGTRSFVVGCGADLKAFPVVLTYEAAATAAANKYAPRRARLKSIVFVPANFRLKTSDEMAAFRTVIVEGSEQSSLFSAAGRPADQNRAILKMLRRPFANEKRILARISNIDCAGDSMNITLDGGVGSGRQSIIVSTDRPSDLTIGAFVAAAASARLACGLPPPSIDAVITYQPITDAPSKVAGTIRSIEFVPDTFELPPD